MAPVALPLARALRLPVTPLILMIGFAANFMGSAMLLGDLPPQMLHSVAGAEFFDFFWQHGRPSSFPILMVTFVITLAAMYAYGFRSHARHPVDVEALAHVLRPLFVDQFALAATLLYWITVPIVGIVEHDAYILTFLYTIRDLEAEGVASWPLYWMLLWSGTLGSNLTVAGAPALFAALNICQREEKRKVSLREFLAWSVPFTLVATAVCYVLGMLIWVLPYAG